MIRINEIKLPLDYTHEILVKLCAKALRISENAIKNIYLQKRSIDARSKDNIIFTANVDVELSESDENLVLRKNKSTKIFKTKKFVYEIPKTKPLEKRPIVVGAGPAGLFAALTLAKSGQRPILIERGKSVDDRTKDVDLFWNGGNLDPDSNVQFGEGGAGAFSDGKLNTGTKNPLIRTVLEELVAHGSPEEILYNAKPHIGTDKLKPTVKSIRNDIISHGGEVRFSCKLTKINVKNDCVQSIEIESPNGTEIIETDNVILALGHSARDTFEMLKNIGIAMQAKPFSVGVRIEHLQKNINKSQYGKFWDSPYLGAADYKQSVHLSNDRGVYTFCMCPGGYVVAAASEQNTVVTNGMSEFARDGANANSAVLVGVSPDDFGSDDILAGVEFQRKIEKSAFIAGGGDYYAPVQRVADFLNNKKTTSLGEVLPTYRPGYRFAQVSDYLPQFAAESIKQALSTFDKRIHGFVNGDSILTGAETRSSSPVRILRGEDYQSLNIKGVYPCGEGAGYAGGIVSAAVDGIRAASTVIGLSWGNLF